MIRHFQKWILFSAITCLPCLTFCVGHSAAQEKPNIVFFLADDLGWTGLSCFGSDFYETPHLDRLASEGMRFTDAYAACTVCSPTRASVMSGMYPARLRLTDFIAGQNRPFARMNIPDWTKQFDPAHVTIAESLKLAGYRTGHVGKWHLTPRKKVAGFLPTDQGFDFSFDKPPGSKGYTLKKGVTSESGSSYVTDLLTDKACQFIGDSKENPFFLYFAYHVPHTPIEGREDHVKYFEDKLQAIQAKEEKRPLIHNNPTYAAMVKSMDQSVGRVLEHLEKLNLTENTIVVFTSDNGGLTQRYGKHDRLTENLPLRRGKGSAYEGGVRVPTIAKWPGVTNPGSESSTPIITIDYAPTFMEMALGKYEDEHADSIDGKSIVSLLRDPVAKIERDLYWHYPHYHAGGDGPYSAIRSGNYRLIEFHEDESVRLYDLMSDIGERRDLSESNTRMRDALHKKLRVWRNSVDAQMPTMNPNFDPARQTTVKK